jgi:hypothetical protein
VLLSLKETFEILFCLEVIRMRLLLIFVLIPLSVASYEENLIASKVTHIDPSPSEGLPHLVLLENGSVVFVSPKDKELLKDFEENFEKDQNGFVQGRDGHERQFKSQDYVPTILASGSRSNETFTSMRKDYQAESQCYNRAHVWAWEAFYYDGLKSKKQFLFFTTSYIRKYRYPWWFHVAPSVVVSGRGEEILDRRYASRPLGVKAWVKKFVSSDRMCPVIQRYNEYFFRQDTEDCYLLSVPMYYWQPRDIKRRDDAGTLKKSFLGGELDIAYGEAF